MPVLVGGKTNDAIRATIKKEFGVTGAVYFDRSERKVLRCGTSKFATAKELREMLFLLRAYGID